VLLEPVPTSCGLSKFRTWNTAFPRLALYTTDPLLQRKTNRDLKSFEFFFFPEIVNCDFCRLADDLVVLADVGCAEVDQDVDDEHDVN
jgi:hypothetical protein